MRTFAAGATVLLVACGGDGESHPGSGDAPWSKGAVLVAGPQTAGDPDVGRQVLLNGSYMSCGVPVKLWNDATLGGFVRQALSVGGETGVPGRKGPTSSCPTP
jgi:hypothetical protein